MTTRRLLVRLLCAVLAVTALLAFCAYTLVKFDELTDLKEKLEALELEVASLESSRSKLEVDVDSLNSSLAELEAKVSALESLGLWMPAFDSGWIDVTNEAGQYFEVVHNLNTTDIVVDIIGRASANGGPHQTNLGAVNHVAGWNTIYGGSHDEEVYSLVKTVDGGYALAGYSSSFGAGLSDFWLVKTTAQGIVSWNRTYGGSEAEIAYSLVQTSDGGYAMAGSVYSYVAGEFDCLLVKTDERGNMQWNKTYGGAKADIAYSLAQTSDGGHAVAITSASFDDDMNDFWLVKTDTEGNIQWSRRFGGHLDDQVYSMIQTADGGYALCGCTHSFGFKGFDFWLIKTDDEGEMEWNQTYGGSLNDWARTLVQTEDGGYVLAGYTGQFLVDSDFMCVKVDRDGNMQWNKTYGGPLHEEAYSIIQTSEGGYAMAGYTESYGSGNYDFWLVKIDSNGNVQWSQTFGGSGFDQAYCLGQTVDGSLVIAGRVDSFGAAESDLWLVKTDVEVGLAWVSASSDRITLYRGETDLCWNFIRVRVWKTED